MMNEFYLVKDKKTSRVYLTTDWEHDDKKEEFLQEVIGVDWQNACNKIEKHYYNHIPGHGYYDN